MTGAPAVHRLLHRCRFCSHWRAKEEFIGGVVTGQCLVCLEVWRKNLDALTRGAMPHGCPVCDRTSEELSRLNANGDCRMYLHRIDGVAALLCADCSDEYERKRLDQFGGTPYGHLRQLKGAH